MKELETLKVVIDAVIRPYKEKMNAIKKETSDAMKQVDASTQKGSKSMQNLNGPAKKVIDSIRSMNAEIRKMSNDASVEAGIKKYSDSYLNLQQAIKDTERQIDILNKKQASMPDTKRFKPSEDYLAAQNQYESALKRIDELSQQKQMYDDIGIPNNDGVYQKLVEQLEEVRNEAKYVKGELDEMVSDGSSQVETDAWKGLSNQIQEARSKLQMYNGEKMQMESSGANVSPVVKGLSSGSMIESAGVTAKTAASVAVSALKQIRTQVAETIQSIPVIGRVLTESAYLGRKGLSLLSFALKGIGAGIVKAGGAAASMIQKFASGIPVLNRFTGAARRTGQQGGILSRALSTLGMTARFMAASFLITGVFNGVKDGMNNLAGYSNATNQSLSLLVSQLNQLKNALATAFSPILEAVTPMLSQLIDYVLAAVNALAQFFAAITGKSSYTVAKRVSTDYAASLGKTASSADKANTAAEKLKRTLLGFDEVNKLDDDDSSGGGGSGGGGGGGTGVGAGNMFTTETIDTGIADFAKMVKEAWEKADFTEIGEIFGRKLNEALGNIPWEKIKETSRKIAKSIATFLNGFIAATDWELVGKTFAEGINTVIEFAYTFVETFDWAEFGQAIADAIDGFIKNLDWTKAGQTLSDGFKGIFSTINTALEQTDWNAVGEGIGTFLTNIDWVGCLAAVGTAICNAIIAVIKLAEGLVDAILSGLKKVDWKKVAKEVWKLFLKGLETVDTVITATVFFVKEAGQTLAGLIGTTLTVTVTFVKKIGQTLARLIGNALTAVVTFVKKAGQTLAGLIGTATSATVSFVKKARQSLAGLIGTGLTATVSFVKKAGQTLARLIGSYLAVKISLIKTWSGTIKNWLGIASTLWVRLGLPRIGINWGSKTVAGFTIKYPKGFYTYAKGGFPQNGEMFIANEAGPEMIGKIGRKSTVANSQQITTAIAAAVGPAVYSAMMSAMQFNGSNGGSKVEVILQGDAKKFFKAMQQEAVNYTNSHHTAPFPV